MTEEERKIRYIMLTLMDGIGPVTQNLILDKCGDIEECFKADRDKIESLDHNGLIGKKKINAFFEQRESTDLLSRAKDILDDAWKTGLKIVARDDLKYPERFKGISDMPVLLYVKGNLRINDFRFSIGVVGARRCSVSGKEKTIETVSDAAGKDIAVISGMAKGIDSYAHTAAIKSGGYTVAVLENGADICYPKEHDRLYESIAESGCILSEYPPGTSPRSYMFPRRNRLIAALSDRLYVIDAGRNSGTESKVQYCHRYGRDMIKWN